ncbi:DUF1501 domain-containing protein [Paenibacillus lutrae]|uniref:DUF1501 domain-containing protein n=1 Tax=Paenibacillus lutrae TaxID=2078573 RepID=A0A7X3FG48_9BACL|nr:DUF1501 domain-containing protein [Paenibacillus lutrae]MVO99009.1 DUF1501 domain-containing protein [Paenibacillus lutrae]
MNLTRREFLIKGTALVAALGLGGPLLYADSKKLLTPGPSRDTGKALVVVQLSGGSDGLNTLIPYGIGAYHDARPTLKLKQHEVFEINGQLGLHPSLSELNELYKRGKLAIVQGVGYPKQDYSHFRSMEIWHTAEPEKRITNGWVARYAAASLDAGNPLRAVQLGKTQCRALMHDSMSLPLVSTIDSYKIFTNKTSDPDRNRLNKAFLDMYDPGKQITPLRVICSSGMEAYRSVEAVQALAPRYREGVIYPDTAFARELQLAVRLLASGSDTRVFYTQVGPFDDHAHEKANHGKMLRTVDAALGAFYRDLEAHGLQDKVMTMAFSEFGRRVKENGSGGTDHGTAGPVFLLGGSVSGGLYGAYPSLTKLIKGDLESQVDFRSIYYTIVEDWLQGDAKSTLGRTYEKLSFI